MSQDHDEHYALKESIGRWMEQGERIQDLERQLHTANTAAKVYKEIAEETQAALRGFAELKAFIEAQRDRATPQWTGLVLETILVRWPRTPPEPPQPVSEAPKPESSTRSAEGGSEDSEPPLSVALLRSEQKWMAASALVEQLAWLTEEVLRLRGMFQVDGGTVIVHLP